MDNLEHQRFPLTRRITLRRRSTTFVPRLSRANSVLGKQNKSNPYVGWFRHSPPTRRDSAARNFVADLFEHEKSLYKESITTKSCSSPTSLPLSKHSPHVGWFRHSPPSEVTLVTSRALERETEWLLQYLSHGLVSSEKLKSHNKLLSHSARKMVVSGRLRGGGQEDDTSLVRTFQESSLEGTLETAKVLYKLAWWFLFPVAYDSDPCRFRGQRVAPWSSPVEDALVHFLDNWNPNTTPKSECNMQDGLVEERRDDESDSDDDGSTSSELSAVSSLPHDLDIPAINDLSLSVSSLAEAYHAHYAAQEYAHMGINSMNHDDHANQMDYVITQMDVARMSRNASRHLDVQSILSLPVITYEAKNVDTRPKLSESCDSWTIIEGSHKSCVEENSRDDPVQEDSLDVCVICLEPFMHGDRLRVLPCNHSFHTGCIDRWLSGSQSTSECYTTGCPTCKTQAILSEEPQDGTVPSWAFAQVGSALYESSSLSLCS